MVVKGPPERVRRQVIEGLRVRGQSADGYEDYTETLEYLSYDCRNKSYRRLSSTDYAGDGNQLSTEREEYRSSYVIPDTIGEKLFDVACKPTPAEVTQSEQAAPYATPTPVTRSRTAAPEPFVVPPTSTSNSNTTTPAYAPPVAENGSYYGEVSPETGRPKTVHVEGYYRSDGTYVRGHYRSAPRKRN
jgi:hypothetical protein